MNPRFCRVLIGVGAILAVVGVIVLTAKSFVGGYADTVPLTVISQRAGLVMNPDAKVNLLGVQVGRVTSIDELRNGEAAIRLAVDPEQLSTIPANVIIDISSPTVFGAKTVNFVPPADPAAVFLRPGQTLSADHVTVEFNTIFEQLTSVLSKIEPDKLNETLTAMSSALNGRGERIGSALTDFDRLLAELEPSLPALDHDLEVSVQVFDGLADAAPAVTDVARNSTSLAKTVVDQQHQLDAFLLNMIGLADAGNSVVGGNRERLTGLLRVLVPTTDLTRRYDRALYCGLAGVLPLANAAPLPDPLLRISTGFVLGSERYRYPGNLPKVAASGGPQCSGLPNLPFEYRPKLVVTDVGIDPARYDNTGILLNSDGLKRYLFGPIDGPPRNTAQIGQPG